MPPVSSLIFVVILAVWAVYLVQHWVRRRDHLATARSVDRFSEAMRVLERRRALPRPDVREHAPRSSPVQLLRPARPQVVIKRGAPASSAATAIGPSAAHRRERLLARVRAAGLLAASVVMVVLVGLSVFEALPWWWSFVGVAVLAATVAGLRWSITRAARRRQALGRRAPARPQGPAPLAAQARAATLTASVPVPATTRRDAPEPPLYDIDEVEAALVPERPAVETAAVADVETAGSVGGVEEVPGGWNPVPVPPPTYTLRAKAHRPAAGPGKAAGSGGMLVDGTQMALDEEFEELPRVDRVG